MSRRKIRGRFDGQPAFNPPARTPTVEYVRQEHAAAGERGHLQSPVAPTGTARWRTPGPTAAALGRADERHSLARGLNDGVQNELLELILRLKLAEEERSTPSVLAATFAALEDHAAAAPTGARPSLMVELCPWLLELLGLSTALAERLARRVDDLMQVRNAVAGLRSIQDASEMLDAATAELCDACGFDRAMLTWIEGSEVIVRSVHIPAHPQVEARVLASGRSNPPRLDDLPVEADMIRRRAPILAADVVIEQLTQPPFVTLLNASAYVAAPIIGARRTIGFLHADVYEGGRPPDEIDRDRLWAFAEGLGYAIEHTMLYERVHAARELTQSAWQSIERLLPADADVRIESGMDRDTPVAAAANGQRSGDAKPVNGFTNVLTKRERDVLDLMVQGATNTAIGQKLVISRGTVKTHVANILRKVGASNRADAVARYLQADPGKT